MVTVESSLGLPEDLGLKLFQQRLPWIGGDLQTLRDTFVDDNVCLPDNEFVHIEIPSKQIGNLGKEKLIAFLNKPVDLSSVKGLILILHGLGGSSRRRGLRRMSFALLKAGFAVLRLNLRGAAPGRKFAAGTYAANCNADVFPAITKAREICSSLGNNRKTKNNLVPLFGVGISLGGTILLNACLEWASSSRSNALDGLVCISSPLDLAASSACIEKNRNKLYQTWLLHRLVKQTLADPFGVNEKERDFLIKSNSWNNLITSSIREFDAAITAPRWGFRDVDDYYKQASPLNALLLNKLDIMPKTLLIHSVDDPWVPWEPFKHLYENVRFKNPSTKLEFLLTNHGGHNGFHGLSGCWGDDVVQRWLTRIVH
ncbi:MULTISPECIES: alpha/beta fold hydrolase [unclassified Prochlorococcus]|uniref:alpha/beta fold hydrolase n=1 Tax=unclassified Prochlorococcus TaxID=2627481 RepID=UPI0005338139|nr:MULTISPECIES: alpha/beta fold hydrolase [unclassified Prochlorococcus]KGG15557.1 Alpha/beta hydrolase [Prochlorococcus sp. MIT 0602]KGG17837.1 Alpha/beta hydrolase [Prochlorococcus sp. MIT 0603]